MPEIEIYFKPAIVQPGVVAILGETLRGVVAANLCDQTVLPPLSLTADNVEVLFSEAHELDINTPDVKVAVRSGSTEARVQNVRRTYDNVVAAARCVLPHEVRLPDGQTRLIDTWCAVNYGPRAEGKIWP